MSKMLSGRWLVTIAAAFTFTWLACNRFFTPEQVIAVVMLAFGFYFGKLREENGGNNGGGK